MNLVRIIRWIDDEEDRLKANEETSLHYVILDMRGQPGYTYFLYRISVV